MQQKKEIEMIFSENKIHRRKIYKRLWYIANKEKIRKKQKEYYQKNKQKVYISRLQYYLENREVIREYYLKNRTEILRKAKERYARKTMQKM